MKPISFCMAAGLSLALTNAALGSDDTLTFGGKAWPVDALRAKLQEKVDATPALKQRLLDPDWKMASCDVTPFVSVAQATDKCMDGPILAGGDQCRIQNFALFRSDGKDEMMVNALLPSHSGCGMNAGSARSDERNIKDVASALQLPEKYGSLKIVKNAYTLDFVADGKNCIGFQDYGNVMSSPDNRISRHTFTSMGYLCDQTGAGFDKARIEGLLAAVRPKGY
jgi:hypothetical protein